MNLPTRSCRPAVLVAVSLSLVVGCPFSCGGLVVMDFSDFTHFTFSRTPALGFCPPLDAVFSAEITVDEEGQYGLSMSILEEGIEGEDVCEDVFLFFGGREVECVKETRLDDRTLSTDDIAAVITTFRAVRVDNNVDPGCLFAIIDPCLITEFAFDSFTVSGFVCEFPRLRADQREMIEQLLENLRSGG